MQSFKNPNQTCSIITSKQFSQLSRVLTYDSTNTTRRRTCYRIIIKGHLADTHGGQITDLGQDPRKLFYRDRNLTHGGQQARIGEKKT